MAKGSLGPFPKTLRWHELLAGENGMENRIINQADASIIDSLSVLLRLVDDPLALDAVNLWTALPLVTREDNPENVFRLKYGLRVGDDLESAILQLGNFNHPCIRACLETVRSISADDDELIPLDHWSIWREFDGPEFCNLAYRFYSNLNYELLNPVFPDAAPADTLRFAKELAVITRAFSARWFNACARFELPSRQNIRWYMGHCLGKLELEYSRELSTWIEQPRKKKGALQPALDF